MRKKLQRDKNLRAAALFCHTGNVPEESVWRSEQPCDDPRTPRRSLVTMTSQCYSELFDPADLIMLTPDAPLYMEQYEPDKVYIIGGKVSIP